MRECLKTITCIYIELIIIQKRILEIIEREFIENLYNTSLTDEKTILYKL